jgi:hypothetical protein
LKDVKHASAKIKTYMTLRCDRAGKINIHIIAHTHNDVGWLKTVDQYYYGSKNFIQHANVEAIITATVAELQKDKRRKFSYVEQAFFQVY